jgi:hypothetical protein
MVADTDIFVDYIDHDKVGCGEEFHDRDFQ